MKKIAYQMHAGFIARNDIKGLPKPVVTYNAKLAGIDCDCEFVTVCETHGNMIAARTLDMARCDRNGPAEFCEDCRTLKDAL